MNQGKLRWTKANLAEEAYVSYNGTLYVPYIAVYIFHGYTGTLYVAYMNALPKSETRSLQPTAGIRIDMKSSLEIYL